ncbi:MAG: hypothetical protein ACOCXP_02850 [Candidatus Dojkabacteria bacterium]
MKTLEIDKKVTQNLEKYFKLEIGKDTIACPYFINTARRKDLRALMGKGTPEEIVLETKVWAQVKGVDLYQAHLSEIRDLMTRVGIGIDCSGFVYHGLEKYLRDKYGKGLLQILKFDNTDLRSKFARLLRPAENIGANSMTNEQNTLKVALDQVLPGDLLRGVGERKNVYHVALVVAVDQDSKGSTRKIYYWHSHRGYGEHNGVRKGSVEIVDANLPLIAQNWDDHGEDGINYLLENDLKPHPEDSGFRRLKIKSLSLDE